VQNADQSLAEAWDNSAAAREELGEQPGMIRRAIGLGRSLLDPLAVLASLCGKRRTVAKAGEQSHLTSYTVLAHEFWGRPLSQNPILTLCWTLTKYRPQLTTVS
jgi:hypothetical protein